MKRRLTLMLVALAAAGCPGRHPQPPPAPVKPAVVTAQAAADASSLPDDYVYKDKTEVVATIVGYDTNVLQYDYGDGTFESLDGTEMTIISPESMAGQTLFIFHNVPIDNPDSLWRKPGAKVRFLIPAEMLQPADGSSYDIFSAGIALEEVP
jgi:hypothetical protein